MVYFNYILIIVSLTTIVKRKTLKYNGFRGDIVIDYSPFWATLNKSEESTYTLIKNHRISSSTIDKLRKNKPLNTTTINDLCRILHCQVENIMRYVPSEKDQIL